MMLSWRTVSRHPERILFFLALGLAVLAAIAGDPAPDEREREEKGLDWSGVDCIGALDLAGWIMDRRQDLVIIDIRSPEEYEEYHIPRAVNIPLADSTSIVVQEGAVTVVYSRLSGPALELYGRMKARGADGLSVLMGGVDAWFDEVIFPDLSRVRGADSLERIKRISLYFGGTPRNVEMLPRTGAGNYVREGC